MKDAANTHTHTQTEEWTRAQMPEVEKYFNELNENVA